MKTAIIIEIETSSNISAEAASWIKQQALKAVQGRLNDKDLIISDENGMAIAFTSILLTN